MKRKHSRGQTDSSSSKKSKKAVDLDSLPWTKLEDAAKAARGVFDDESTGFMLGGLEEVSDVEVVYTEQDGRKTASFVVSGDKATAAASSSAKSPEPEFHEDEEEWTGINSEPEQEQVDQPQASTSGSTESKSAKVLEVQQQPFERIHAPALGRLPILDALKHSLLEAKFNKPTPIQTSAWKHAFTGTGQISSRDLVGVAQTGSGKTLAYGLPLLQHAFQHPDGISALILTPTRELALQVRKHLAAVADGALVEKPSKGTRSPITILALTGGMSVYKQKRQLEQGAQILVGTPGRVWDLISQDISLAKQLKQLQFLVLDEADRMVEAGHYAELEKIFDLTNRK